MANDIQDNEARVNVTYAGANGDLPDPVMFDSTDGDIRGWVAEALRTGGVPGIAAQAHIDLRDFVIDRFTATEARPYNLLAIRPKTPFGAACTSHCYHLFRGAFMAIIPNGHVVEQCRRCGATRTRHRDHCR